jgi:hypothetical protein
MGAEIHADETKASFLAVYFEALSVRISDCATSASGLQVNDFVGVLFNDTL